MTGHLTTMKLSNNLLFFASKANPARFGASDAVQLRPSMPEFLPEEPISNLNPIQETWREHSARRADT